MKMQSQFACIGWGSLIWHPDTLPCTGEWKKDGPWLPVEFARQSLDKRITLVICPEVPLVQTCWSKLTVLNIDAAISHLAHRECPGAPRHWADSNVGCWTRSSEIVRGRCTEAISKWAEDQGLAGVVWTNLPCRFSGESGVMPTGENIIAHLRSLKGPDRSRAETYVRRTPKQIDTRYRRLIEQHFGWTCSER